MNCQFTRFELSKSLLKGIKTIDMWQCLVTLKNIFICWLPCLEQIEPWSFFVPVFYFTTVSHLVWCVKLSDMLLTWFDATSYWRGWNSRQLLQRFPERLQTKSSKHLCNCTLCYPFDLPQALPLETHMVAMFAMQCSITVTNCWHNKKVKLAKLSHTSRDA